jgi:diaminopropionate ammonia-lyase
MNFNQVTNKMFNVNTPTKLLSACPAYHITPLLECLYNDHKVILKDESNRMGLGSFKALGGIYAVAQLISKQVEQQLSAEDYLSAMVQKIAKEMTFVCASAGNHGIAVATGAKIFGSGARIHLAETVPEEFAIRLRDKGAEVIRSGSTYEESILAAIADAQSTHAIHLADGSWPGYTEIPQLVMEGYTVIAQELQQQFEQTNTWPSHVYLQAGVGGLAAAICYMIRHNWPVQPKIIIVEPELAPCLAQSVKQGQVITVQGDVSNMGRLDCKTPSLLAFEILRHLADSFVTLTDNEAVKGVTIAKQLGLDTTASGAAGLAALIRDIDDDSLPLAIITEGRI